MGKYYNLICENNGLVKIDGNFLIYENKIIGVVNCDTGILMLPENYQTVKNLYKFCADAVNEIIIPDSIDTVEYRYVAGSLLTSVETLVFEEDTPIELPQNMLVNIETNNIYVPDASVETYKTAWTNVADKIKPISEKPTTE